MFARKSCWWWLPVVGVLAACENGSTPYIPPDTQGNVDVPSLGDAAGGTDAAAGTDAIADTDASAGDAASSDVPDSSDATVTPDTSGGTPCQTSANCPPGAYCKREAGKCAEAGVCKSKTVDCNDPLAPTCGCDGNTYDTPCKAEVLGGGIAKAGACAQPGCDIGVGPCPAGQFCKGNAGTCQGKGACSAKPVACDSVYAPVCGCDGKTYGNDCEAAGAGVTVAKTGECGTAGTCNPATGNACPAGQFCQPPQGQCSASGTCTAKPSGCPDIYSPVCGCDGKDYGNSCEAAAVGVGIAGTGQCKPGGGCDIEGGFPCAADMYCKGPSAGTCSGVGTCTQKPIACPAIYAPVCGCDGKTYSSACDAAGGGTNVASQGECGGGKLQWFSTCGDPVCMGWKAKPGVPDCTTQKEGAACTTDGGVCDPHSDCNSLLKCTTSDPKQQPGGCPISRAKWKSEVRYLTPADAARAAEAVRGMSLTSWQGPGGRTQLALRDAWGADVVPAPGRQNPSAGADMVAMYQWLSLSVATMQDQQRRLDQLTRDLEQMKPTQAPTCGR